MQREGTRSSGRFTCTKRLVNEPSAPLTMTAPAKDNSLSNHVLRGEHARGTRRGSVSEAARP